MPAQEDVLPELVDIVRALHSQCAVVLIGSVANGTHGPHSDIDLNLFFPESCDLPAHPYVGDDNRWQLKVKEERHGFRVDVAWETYEGLASRLRGDGARECWPFANGKVLLDPLGSIAPWLRIAKE